MPRSRPPLWHRTGTRVALGVTISFFLGSIVLTPIWQWIADYFHPEDSPDWNEGWTPAEFTATAIAILLIGAFFGGIFGLAIGRVTTRRLERIASQAAAPFGAKDPLPGPFDEAGRDEIAQLAGALNRMRERAHAVMRDLTARDTARSEWVAQVSHDLRTPLAALTTSLDLIERRLERGETKELAGFVAAAQADTGRVANLATDLLEIARLEVAPELQCEPLEPEELAQHALRTVTPLAHDSGVELTLDSRLPDETLIEADGRLLLRALENLLVNSIQHARGRATLRLEMRPRTSAGHEVHLRFTVEDDGPGLPEGADGVNFASLKDERSRPDSSGLGLIVTARVAALHGGRADASNLTSGGASVWFEIATERLGGTT